MGKTAIEHPRVPLSNASQSHHALLRLVEVRSHRFATTRLFDLKPDTTSIFATDLCRLQERGIRRSDSSALRLAL